MAEGNAFFLLICHMFPISHLTILGFYFFGELAMVKPEESPLQILTSDGLIQPQEVRCLSISSVCKSAGVLLPWSLLVEQHFLTSLVV